MYRVTTRLIMRSRLTAAGIIWLLLLNAGLPAASVSSLDEAVSVARTTGKPILLEFFHPD
jgi:hypothetical protein